MKKFLLSCILVSVILFLGNRYSYSYGPIFSGAMTLNNTVSISTPLVWVKATELHFPKYQDDSNLLFTSQITFTQDEIGPYGIMFKMKFRTEDGIYISESPFTGCVSAHSYVYQNAMLSDTIIDWRVTNHPPAGEYVAELWCYTGGGTLNIVSQATNITIQEAPFYIHMNEVN